MPGLFRPLLAPLCYHSLPMTDESKPIVCQIVSDAAFKQFLKDGDVPLLSRLQIAAVIAFCRLYERLTRPFH